MKVKVKFLLASLAFASLAGCSKTGPGNMKEPGSTLSQKENFNQEVKTGAIIFKASGDSLFFYTQFEITDKTWKNVVHDFDISVGKII